MKSVRLASLAFCFAAMGCAQITSYTISTVVGVNPLTGAPAIAGYFGDSGLATSAELNAPIAAAVDSSGNLYIVDSGNNVIRKVTKSTGKISTFAGIYGSFMYAGDGGAATSASFNVPYGIAIDSSGNIYVSDYKNHAVRKVNTSGTISTVAGTGIYGFSGDGGPGSSAQLNAPIGLAIDSQNNLYIADSNNYCIRMLNTTTGIITTVAGQPTSLGYTGDGGLATKAKMGSPFGVAIDSAGNLYISDKGDNRIREVSDGVINTIAGTGAKGFGGDGGPAVKAVLSQPWGLSVDPAGNLYVADYGNNRIRLISKNGIITTLAGFAADYGGDGGPAINATLNFPTTTVVDPSTGNVYIADTGNNVIRLLTPSGSSVSGVQSAGQFGALPAVAPGTWMEIYGANLATSGRSWTCADFTNNCQNAPTALDGNSVTIGGQPAYVDYISGGQVNVQAPTNVATGQQQLVVTNSDGSKATYTVTVNATEPGIYALPQFIVGGKQYAGAVANDGVTFIMPPGAVAGFTSQRANPGDRITFYGIGFGPVTPAVNGGQVASGTTSLSGLQFQIGGQTAQIQYAGLAPGLVGLYQFNVYVPSGLPANDLTPVTFTLNGTAGIQTLYVAVQ